MKRTAVRTMGAVVLGTLACVAPRQEAPPPGAEGPPEIAESPSPSAPSPGGTRAAGTLSWEELSVRLVGRQTSAGLRIDVTTLNDEALAVAAPDIRTYLADLKGRISEAGLSEQQARELTPFLVGYTGFEKQVSFDPTLLLIHSEGSTLYPRYIIPMSRDFDRRLVDLYETVYGIYLFDPGIDVVATLEFRYGELTSGAAWRGIVQRIQRAKVRTETED
jgi:hypothetical protein